MRSAQRPSEMRWLRGVALGIPLLIIPLVLALADLEVCELPRMAKVSCSGAPGILYEVLVGAGVICLLHSFYRAYLDFGRGALERDLENWSGRHGQGPVQAAAAVQGAVTQERPAAIASNAAVPSESEWGHEINRKVETMLASYEPAHERISAG